MRWLLLLLASSAWGLAPNTVIYATLDNTLAFTSSTISGDTMGQVGTVPFVTSPAPPFGTYAAGTFWSTRYAYYAVTRTGLASSSTFTIEAYIYLSSIPAERLFFGAGSGGDAIDFVITTDGRVKYVTDNANVYQSAAGVITTGAWYYVAAIVNGTNLQLWSSAFGSAPVSVVNTTATSPAWPTSGTTNIGVGSIPGVGPLTTGYLSYIRISSVARGSLPTTDSLGSLSPYINGSQFPFVSPIWWRR